jgi:hypothetical protein
VVDRGVNAIVYMVDAADSDKIEAARNELHNLLEKPQLAGIPVLVLGMRSCIMIFCILGTGYRYYLLEKPQLAGIPVFVLGMRSCILTILTCKVSDPYLFYTDPDPGFL